MDNQRGILIFESEQKLSESGLNKDSYIEVEDLITRTLARYDGKLEEFKDEIMAKLDDKFSVFAANSHCLKGDFIYAINKKIDDHILISEAVVKNTKDTKQEDKTQMNMFLKWGAIIVALVSADKGGSALVHKLGEMIGR